MLDWTKDKVRRLTELVCDPNSYSESQIARIMSEEFDEEFSRDAVHNKILRLELRSLTDKPVTDIMPYYNKYREIIEGEGILKLFEVRQHFEFPKSKLKILYLGDTHIPFQVDEQIQLAVNRNLAADMVVTTEVTDCYAISRFNKNLSVPFEVEVDNVVRYFEFLSNTFPMTIVMSSNHDKRVLRQFMKGVPASLLFLVEDNMLEYLAKPFPNVVVVNVPYLQINDAIFTHAEFFSKVDLKAGVNVYSYLNEWKNVLRLKDFRLVVQGHTHQLGATYRGGGFKVMEGGCLCRVPDYAVEYFYSKPQVNGYIVIVQHDGVTEFDLTREYTFETQVYIPNWSPLEV